jgi:chromosome segregation ATPase
VCWELSLGVCHSPLPLSHAPQVLEEANGRIAEMTTDKGALEATLRRLEEQLAEATDKLATEEAARSSHGVKEEELARQLAERSAALMQMEAALNNAQQEGAKRSEQPSADQAARLAALQSKLEELQVCVCVCV